MNIKYSNTMKTFNNIVAALALILLQGVALAQTTEVTYYIPDALGSPVAAMDEQGNIKWRKHYQPYGEEIERDEASKDNHIGYTGHAHDRNTGLTYMGARYYDPAIGRFMGMDPVDVKPGDPRTFNRYAYANNNPYGFVDPDGRETEGAMFNVSGGAFGFGFTIGYGPHTDDKGNKTHLLTRGVGKFASLSLTDPPFSLSFNVTHEKSNADTVYDLKGLGSQTTGSLSFTKVSAIEIGTFSGKNYSGTTKGLGASYGTPFSISTLVTDSILIEPAEPTDMSFSDIISP